MTVRLVLAGAGDGVARALVDRWGPDRAALVTPRDLSRPGWQLSVGGGAVTAVVRGRPVPVADLTAVVVRLAGVSAADLPHVRPADRDYAAEEMTAFLLAWLDAVPAAVPVLNRPTPGVLSGPAWRPEQWTAAASRAGLPVVPLTRAVPPADSLDPANLWSAWPGAVEGVVVGDHWVGRADLAPAAGRLAAAAGVTLLAVRFTGPDARFLTAHCWPDLSDPAVADALDAYLRSREPVPC